MVGRVRRRPDYALIERLEYELDIVPASERSYSKLRTKRERQEWVDKRWHEMGCPQSVATCSALVKELYDPS